jgi:ABC-type transport system involved in multi-copper enzyme maturation permease subunit
MLLGPLFTFDLIRLARRGLQPRLRALLVAFLLLGLALLYIDLFPSYMPYEEMLGAAPSLPRNAMSRFGESFMLLYLAVQLAAVILFTPVYAAGGIIEEKNRRTLEFLQASQLTGREIAVGKFAARIVFVLSVLLAGLPVLMLAAFFGGIDPERLLYGFTIAIVEAIFLGGFATLQAVKFRTLGAVLLRTYLLLGGFTALALSCVVGGDRALSALSAPTTLLFTVLYPVKEPDRYHAIALFVATHLLASMVFLESAIVRLRRLAGEPETPHVPSAIDTQLAHRAMMGEDVLTTTGVRDGTPTITPIATDDPLFQKRVFHDVNIHAPPIGDRENPIVWKELHFTGRVVRKGTGMETLLMLALVVAIYPILLWLLVSIVRDINNDVWIGRTINEAVKVFLLLVLIVAPVVAGLRAAACIGTERQQDTMLGLLTLPWSRAELLGAKWWSAIRWLRRPLRIAGIVLLSGVVLLGVTPYAAFCAAVLIAGFLAFTSAAGLLMSVRCGSVMRATLGFMLLWFVAVLGPNVVNASVGETVSPPFVLWEALEYPMPTASNVVPTEHHPRRNALLVGAGYACLAWFCWRGAAKRFEMEGKN